MRGIDRNYRWLVAITGVLVLSIALGGTAIAKKKKTTPKGWLGVYIQDVDKDAQEAWDLDTDEGIIISDIVEDSPAEEAGLEQGDVILEFDGKTVTSSSQLTRMIRRTKPDTEVKIEIIRDGESNELTVVLGERERDYTVILDDDDFFIDIPRVRIPKIEPFKGRTFSFYSSGARGQIGIQLHDLNEQLGEYFGVEDGQGVLVEKVLEDSPAEEAGINAGDVIIEINGEEVSDVDDVIDEISDLDEGDVAEITVLRKGSKKTFAVEIEEDDTRSDYRTIVRKYERATPRYRAYSLDKDELDDWREAQEELREALKELREELREALKETQEELWEAIEELRDAG